MRFWRFLGVGLTLLVAGCSAGGNDSPTAAPTPTSAVAPSTVPAKTVEAVVDTKASGCDPKVITDGCWLPLYAQPSTDRGSAMNLGREAATQCTEADTRGCWPQPGETVPVVCMTISVGEIWFGVPMTDKQVLTHDPTARRTSNGETIGFNRAKWFELRGDTFPQTC